MTPIPTLLVGTVDPILRDTALMCLLTDLPEAVGVRYDLLPDQPGYARRVTMTARGLDEDVLVELDHTCVTCGVNEDVVRAGLRAVSRLRSAHLVVANPVGAPSSATARILQASDALRLAAVIAACDPAVLADDVLGDDLLVERGLHLAADDERAVGQAVAAQVGHADFVITPRGKPSGVGSELLDHVRAADSHRLDGFTSRDLSELLHHNHHEDAAGRRTDPLSIGAAGGRMDDHVWTLHIENDRPFHPARLRQNLRRLALNGTYNRGHFWLATRPFTACAWEGVGGQLSIGAIGDWGCSTPRTHLAFTGTHRDGRQAVIDAFDDSLLTAAEVRRGPAAWMDLMDEYDPWLGARDSFGTAEGPSGASGA